MEVFRELDILGDDAAIAATIIDIGRSLPEGWTRDGEIEEYLRQGGPGSRTYCFSTSEGGERPAASLFLNEKSSNSLYVSNIIPRNKHRLKLTCGEYNEILENFAEMVARPSAEKSGAIVKLTAAHADLDQWLLPAAAKQLRTFSRLANKSTGSAHPLDKKRWFHFLNLSQREGSSLDAETLRRWLVENEGWPPEIADQLAGEYEFGRQLLASSVDAAEV